MFANLPQFLKHPRNTPMLKPAYVRAGHCVMPHGWYLPGPLVRAQHRRHGAVLAFGYPHVWIRCAYWYSLSLSLYIYIYMPVYVNADIYGHDVLYYSMTITIIYCVYCIYVYFEYVLFVSTKMSPSSCHISFSAHLSTLLGSFRFAFFQSLRMIFFQNMRLILRCLRRSIVNSVAANRCSTSGLLSGNAFFCSFWPLTGRCTRGTEIWRRLMVEVLEGCLYYNWLQNLKDTTIHYPSPISRPIPAQCHVAWLKLVDAGGQNPRMHMYNCYYGSCKWVFTSHCIYRFLFVYDIVKRYPSHMSECKCTHAA